MKTETKTIDINAKEWFDKANGNSYFSALVTVNYGMDDEKTLKIPFQYGYGNQYEWEAQSTLAKEYELPDSIAMSRYCRENGIILRSNKEKNCRKRDCKEFVA